MRTDHDLIQLLDDEPPVPSAVDVRGAIAAGRRRRTVHRAGWAGATATALAVAAVLTVNGDLVTPRPAPTEVAGPLRPPTSCTVHDLPGVRDSRMTGVNVTGADYSGHYFAGRTEPTATAVRWADGQGLITDLPGDGKSAFTDVNSSGMVVGWRYAKDDDAEPVPFTVVQGAVSPLPGVERGFPFAVNDSAVVVGQSGGFAVRWSSALDGAVRLPVPPGTQRSSAVAIDRDGTIAGTVIGAADWRAVVWLPDGSRRELESPDIDGTRASVATAIDIRNGWVVGSAATTAQTPTKDVVRDVVKSVTVRWSVETGEAEVIDEAAVQVSAVTADGWLVGADASGRPVMVAGDTTVALPLPADSQAATDSRYTVSDDGRIVTGLIVDSSATRRPVVWRCS
ncbi:hypothetical protein [Actinoplanes sp. CA-252034]|uniref:hypothetical protein n=1 Tax=Actinoplanes sp. CA-252034 TaxID=3239906 RepID=UPI003D992B4A